MYHLSFTYLSPRDRISCGMPYPARLALLALIANLVLEDVIVRMIVIGSLRRGEHRSHLVAPAPVVPAVATRLTDRRVPEGRVATTTHSGLLTTLMGQRVS